MQIVKTFSNLDGFRAYLDTAPENAVFKGMSLYSRKNSESFTGTGSYDEANTLLRDGDAKSAAALKEATVANIKTLGDGKRTRRFNSVAGGVANVPATIMGLPKSMIRTERVKYKDSKVLNICYNGTAAGSVDKTELRETAARLMGAIVGLEKNGYRVNLYLYIGSRSGSNSCNMFVRIKDSAQYLDIKKTAYPLINPSMLRRHYFRFVETAPGLTDYRFTGGYGSVIDDETEIKSAAKKAGLVLKKIVSFYDLRRIKSAAAIMEKLSD